VVVPKNEEEPETVLPEGGAPIEGEAPVVEPVVEAAAEPAPEQTNE